MALLNFEIPATLNTLLEENYEHYYIKETIPAKRLKEKLKEARQLFKEDGAGYIIDYFDTYISVITNKSQTPDDVLIMAYEDLHRAVIELNKTLTLILTDKELLVDEVKLKYVNLIKMLIYAYVNVIITTDTRLSSEATFKNSKKSKDTCTQKINKGATIQQLNTLLQQEIRLFWDPPRVEEPFITIITEICYYFLEKSSIKSDKEIVSDIFNLFGTLLTEYRYSAGFVFRIAELVKSHDHTVLFVSQGIKLLVESYNAKGLVREFVKQITEWQTDEKLQNAEATRNCANVLTEMAKLMPKFMVGEVMYLTEYLSHESYSLRISVLNVITEILLTTLFKVDLTDEEKESREEFLEMLSDHIKDISAFVRARVMQNWCRVQKENFLTPVQQTTVLRKLIPHLKDKGSNVRKCAIACITSFLEHNPFGSELKLKQMQETFDKEKETYEKIRAEVCDPHVQKIKEAEEEWSKIKDEVKEVIENNVNQDDEEEESEQFNLTMQQVIEIVKMFVKDKKYREALKITKAAVINIPQLATWKQTRMSEEELQNETDFYLKLMCLLYVDVVNQLGTLLNVENTEKEKLIKQEELVNYYQNAVEFLTEIEDCIVTMRDLMESVNISEVHEAIEFFIVSYKFNIDNSLQGILEMLNIMQRPEQDRKSAVIKALKKIFLETNASSMPEHVNIIVERLISFLKIIPCTKVTNFKVVIYNWVIEGKLDNNIIERLFQYFVKKEQVSDEISLKAVQLLTLIAPGKKTIVTKNLRMISEVILEKRCANDMILLAETCKLLTAGTLEPQLVTDKNPPFKLKPTDNIWKILSDILFGNFDKDIPFYNLALINAIRFIYSLCSKPDQICEELIIKILTQFNIRNNPGEKEFDIVIIIRLCHLLGEVAICQLWFLDETVYKEIKRRFYITTEEVNNKNSNKRKTDKVHDFSTASSSKRNMTSSSTIDDGDDSILEGAQADDAEADFILNVLEHKIVTSLTSLGALSSFIANICEHPKKYDDEHLQCTAVLALLKYMLVSSKFCSSYTRLIFSLLEKSTYVEVKCNIIISVGDLLERFPNVIEPWSIHLYNRLNDPEHKVQITAFHILANLLLRDMLLVKSHISYMAIFISEERNELSDMSKNFFSALAIRDNHLYNVLPDVFTHLVNSKNVVDEEQFRYIMKHLIGLITAVKHTENLVDRFCLKFQGTDDPYICTNIAYSLSLLQYNERAAKKFSENFDYYKHIIHITDVYSFVKQTINSWSKLKNDIKETVTELEEKINGVFEIREGDDDNRNTPRPTRPVFKKPKGRAIRKNKKRIKMSNDNGSDEDENDASASTSTPVRKSNRKRADRISSHSTNSDSD